MASPVAEAATNGISTPPATASGANPSPPTQPSQSQPHLTNGANSHAPTAATAAPVPAFPSTSLQDPGTSKRPRDARLIHLLLAHMGVHAYADRVPLQLLDFSYRYTSGILSDAISYEPATSTQPSGGAKKRSGATGAGADEDGVSLAALRTAVASRAALQFSAQLPKEYLAELASERNRIALPRVEREFGLRLPPERYCFTGVGWDVRKSWEEEVDGEEAEGDEMDVDGDGQSAGETQTDTVGAGFGGPVGGEDVGMGGMGIEEEVDEDEFQDVMGS